MNFSLTLNFIGIILIITSLFMAAPLIVSLAYHGNDVTSIFLSLAITFLTGFVLYLFTKKHRKDEVGHRDGFIIVTLSWTAMALFSSLPYILSESIPSFTDALFESMSGYTTTGASILNDLEALPKGILFWRSLTHWMGGVGIVVMSLAILPVLGAGGMQLFRAETSDVMPEKFRPKVIEMAKSIYIVYIAITVAGVFLLMAGGMDLYDSICHSFGAIATGGFSVKNLSIGHYDSPYVDYVIILLMYTGGINFTLHYFAFKGMPKKYLKSNEFIFFSSIIIISTLVITSVLFYTGCYDSITKAFRFALFQVVSITTATGYVTADFEEWPVFIQLLLVCLMFFGGMVGSTAGGIKQIRILLMFKQIYREFYMLIHPHAITYIKLDGKKLSKEILGGVWGFVFLFIAFWVVSTLLMTACGVDLLTSATATVSAMSNVGPALGDAGPTENYSGLPMAGKWILTLCMLVGRLEIYTVIVLFMPVFWKK